MNINNLEFVTAVIKNFLGDAVVVTDLGWTAPGIHQYSIIVGKKPNPVYDPKFDGMTEEQFNIEKTINPLAESLRKQKPETEDVRVLNLNGTEDANAIRFKLKNIKETMPGATKAPIIDETIAAVNNTPLNQTYNIEKDQADADFEKAKDKLAADDAAYGLPKQPDLSGVMEEVMETLENISDRLSKLEEKKSKK